MANNPIRVFKYKAPDTVVCVLGQDQGLSQVQRPEMLNRITMIVPKVGAAIEYLPLAKVTGPVTHLSPPRPPVELLLDPLYVSLSRQTLLPQRILLAHCCSYPWDFCCSGAQLGFRTRHTLGKSRKGGGNCVTLLPNICYSALKRCPERMCNAVCS